MPKLKKSWEERVRKGKPKSNPICKVHKGLHVYGKEVEEYISRLGGTSRFTRTSRCECGKKNMEFVDWEMGEKLEALKNIAFDNRHITDLHQLVDIMEQRYKNNQL